MYACLCYATLSFISWYSSLGTTIIIVCSPRNNSWSLAIFWPISTFGWQNHFGWSNLLYIFNGKAINNIHICISHLQGIADQLLLSIIARIINIIMYINTWQYMNKILIICLYTYIDTQSTDTNSKFNNIFPEIQNVCDPWWLVPFGQFWHYVNRIWKTVTN